MSEHSRRQTLIVTHNEGKSRKLYEDFLNMSKKPVEQFPAKDLQFYDVDALSSERLNQRLKVLSRLNNNEEIIVITSIDAIVDKILSPYVFTDMNQRIEYGKELDLGDTIEKFVQSGYERVNRVEGKGQFSLR